MPKSHKEPFFPKISVFYQWHQSWTLLSAWALGTQGPRGNGRASREPGPHPRRELSEEILLEEGKPEPSNQEGPLTGLHDPAIKGRSQVGGG